MTDIYRFRSTASLLGAEFAELERQTIFCAAPEDLNDPMEGFRDIVWTGDQIVWTNLFKDYVNCLYWSYQSMLVMGEDILFEPAHVRYAPPWNSAPTPKADDLFNAIWTDVREQVQISQLALQISSSGRRARRAEITTYIRGIHISVLQAIRRHFIENGLMPAGGQPVSESGPSDSTRLVDIFDQAQWSDNQELCDALFSYMDSIMVENALIYSYNHRFDGPGIAQENKLFLVHHFPNYYVEQLEQLLWPNWYTACFTKDFHNSSMWGHYGDKHRGACLIFESDDTDDGASLTLNHITGARGDRDGNSEAIWSFQPIPMRDVLYREKPGEVDFFKSIGKLTERDLLELWYTGEDGNLSECAGHLDSGDNREAWRKRYWDTFQRDIAFKTKDWEYEQECRLPLYPLLANSLDEDARTLSYDFKSLKGLIFGMKMSDDDKRRIIEIIDRKCRESHRTDFQFYQAYYSPETGDIRRRELRITFSDINETKPSD